MYLEKKYIINTNFMYMVGYYDRHARLCTLVKELHRTFVVERSPLEILNDSIKCIGFDLRGAMETAKWLLGNQYMCPIMVNPIHRICVFPDKCAKKADVMWFNPCHIIRTKGVNRNAEVEFTNGLKLQRPLRLYTFNQKLHTAGQFRKTMIGMHNDSLSFKTDPKKGA
ncbi:competence protein ComK [Neobacillus vireti]|uniref:competence protein ComK n=1 Tax=Neobacillus vireti TaxID=220686 RepID=UPI002FFE9330